MRWGRARLLILSFALVIFSTSCDWPTWGGAVERQAYNPFESAIGVDNVSNLHEVWSAPLGAALDAAPVVATVDFGNRKEDIAYLGTIAGAFYAIRLSNGSVLWSKQFPNNTRSCDGSPPGHVSGIVGSAAIDRNLVYFAIDDKVHALDLATGQEAQGWPVTFTPDLTLDFVWSALTIWNRRLYVETSPRCEGLAPINKGKVIGIDLDAARVTNTFYITGQDEARGGSVWGWGGVSVDPATQDVFFAAGNANGFPENYGYGNHVARLTRDLVPIASDSPPTGLFDDDFGSTPVLYGRDGCPPQLAVMRKGGYVYTYNRDAIGAGPTASIPMSGSPYNFIGLPAYSKATNTLFVANPTVREGGGFFVHGMVAFTFGSDCQLHLAWQTEAGGNQNLVSTPMVANGVVYYADGINKQVHAFNERTGAALWTSATLAGNVFAAPVVAKGTLLQASWDGNLHAWKP
jgi:outer membrane protein assembly factor BamB